MVARSGRVLARLISLAQIGELARRLVTVRETWTTVQMVALIMNRNSMELFGGPREEGLRQAVMGEMIL